jgi:uncharacterized protein YdcH (DUF465 family)
VKAIAADARDEMVAALIEEHRRLDERLRILETQRFLTSTEQVEYVQLKKQKLLAKDRIERLRIGAAQPTASA